MPASDDEQQRARALSGRTRYAIFRAIADAPAPLTVAELADRFALHHNAVRQHLATLLDARLVVTSTAPAQGRGRPPVRYALHPSAGHRWGDLHPYERLALWLSEAVRTGDAPIEVGRRAGASTTMAAGTDPVDHVVEHMRTLGFEPEATARGRRVTVTLHRCPFANAAVADPATICSLHLGVAQGLAAATGGLVVDELAVRDPERAGCRLRCHREQAA